jgi:hypothetical protein
VGETPAGEGLGIPAAFDELLDVAVLVGGLERRGRNVRLRVDVVRPLETAVGRGRLFKGSETGRSPELSRRAKNWLKVSQPLGSLGTPLTRDASTSYSGASSRKESRISWLKDSGVSRKLPHCRANSVSQSRKASEFSAIAVSPSSTFWSTSQKKCASRSLTSFAYLSPGALFFHAFAELCRGIHRMKRLRYSSYSASVSGHSSAA